MDNTRNIGISIDGMSVIILDVLDETHFVLIVVDGYIIIIAIIDILS